MLENLLLPLETRQVDARVCLSVVETCRVALKGQKALMEQEMYVT